MTDPKLVLWITVALIGLIIGWAKNPYMPPTLQSYRQPTGAFLIVSASLSALARWTGLGSWLIGLIWLVAFGIYCTRLSRLSGHAR